MKKAGGMARKLRKSLDLAADALARDGVVSGDAVKLMARPLVPRWLYLLMGNIGWRLRARKEGCRDRLDSMPYERNLLESKE